MVTFTLSVRPESVTNFSTSDTVSSIFSRLRFGRKVMSILMTPSSVEANSSVGSVVAMKMDSMNSAAAMTAASTLKSSIFARTFAYIPAINSMSLVTGLFMRSFGL